MSLFGSLKSWDVKMTLKFILSPKRGKGSHGTLYYGTAYTIVRNPKDELKKRQFWISVFYTPHPSGTPLKRGFST